jgi:hypothetical protein
MGSPRRSSGRIGLALDLDGKKDYVSVPHSESLNPGTSLWTVTAWLRKSSSGNQIVVFKDNGNLSSYYYLVVKSKAQFSVCLGGGEMTVQGTSAINDGKWHHVAGVRSGLRTIQLYVDGVLEAAMSFEGSKSVIGTNSPLKIGVGNPYAGLGYFAGSIDQVGLYNRALSADEIKRLYQGR